MKRIVATACAAIALCSASAAAAGVIIQPKGVVVNIGGEFVGASASHMIDQSGLDLAYISGVTDLDAYLANDPFHAVDTGGEWLSTGPRNSARVTFDLGEIMEIRGFVFWNEDSTSLQAIIASTPTGGSYSGTGNIAQNPQGQAYGAHVHRHQIVTTRYVTFDLYGCNQFGFAHNGCGLGEVAFESTAAAPPPGGAVPEPATWAMMILGFGAAGSILRRRTAAACS